QKTEVTSARLAGPALLQLASADLKAVGRIQSLEFAEAPDVAVTDIVLAEQTTEQPVS
ncbi:MAG: valS, partial [Glaciihabitans sp.]|nr:valS [Glaciihabitans sp.]